MPKLIRTKGFNIDFDPRHPSLQTHKVEGTNLLEAYVNTDIRILFERSSDTVILRSVGHHDILKNL